jgi:ABC-2 type transport system permease protein
MKALNIFLFELKHFSRSKAKVLAYLLFVLASTYALYNGFDLQNKHQETIKSIEQKKQEGISEILSWYDEGKKGPEERPRIDITTPFWALWNLPTYTFKEPRPTLPLGIGQTEQYGYYKRVTNWSSVYDNDMVEELANPERLVNGNIDFSFMLIFLLPILLIIFTYNIYGLERDFSFDKLIVIQTGNKQKWISARLAFYSVLLIGTISVLILFVALKNNALANHATSIASLILISILYIIIWTIVFYFIILKSKSSSAIAFKMIGVWLVFCVLIPGAVHQIASIKYPANYMTDYLDANRKEANDVYELTPDTLSAKLKIIYPDLANTIHGKESITDEGVVSNTLSAIINQMNKEAISKIELRNDAKNKFIASSYWYNPISMIHNKWNSITETDYFAYKSYRNNVQQSIDKKIELLVFECWDMKTVDKKAYENYLKLLK